MAGTTRIREEDIETTFHRTARAEAGPDGDSYDNGGGDVDTTDADGTDSSDTEHQ